jgi:hypothetical protein
MAATGTTLASPLDALALDFNVTSSAGATIGGFCRIDGEFSVITGILGNKISVRSRGDNGGLAVAHAVLAPVTFGLASDQANLGATEIVPVPTEQNLQSIGADGPIAVPLRATTYLITKGAALAASTMPNPPLSSDGLEVQFISATDFAHVVSLVTSWDGKTGNKTTYTFTAFKGGAFKVMAIRGVWALINAHDVAIT